MFRDTGEVVPVPLDAANRGAGIIDANRPGVVVVTAFAPLTSVKARYTVAVASAG